MYLLCNKKEKRERENLLENWIHENLLCKVSEGWKISVTNYLPKRAAIRLKYSVVFVRDLCICTTFGLFCCILSVKATLYLIWTKSWWVASSLPNHFLRQEPEKKPAFSSITNCIQLGWYSGEKHSLVCTTKSLPHQSSYC